MTFPTSGIDETGHEWQLRWGVYDPEVAMREAFNTNLGSLTFCPGQTRTFDAPLWGETKTLDVYVDAAGTTRYVVAEITPGVYAIGRDR